MRAHTFEIELDILTEILLNRVPLKFVKVKKVAKEVSSIIENVPRYDETYKRKPPYTPTGNLS